MVTLHPEKPVFVFAVGITGHRLNKLPPEDIGRIKRQLSSTFAEIDAACAAEKARGQGYYAPGAYRLRLVSGMAEGTDQIAVAIRPGHWEVDAVLPFPRVRYASDFAAEHASGRVDRRTDFEAALAQATTIVELPDESDPPAAYQAAGEFILRQSDLLVAVWDGNPRAGPGGSEGIVALAIEAGIPVVWIRSDHDHVPTLVLGPDRSGRGAKSVPATPASIAEIVAGVASPKKARDDEPLDPHSHPVVGAGNRLMDFLTETWRSQCRWVAFDFLLRLPQPGAWRSAIPIRSLADCRADWAGFAAAASDDANFRERITDTLATRYAWADSLATYFAHVYRSAYVLTYGLTAFAVAIALLDVLPFAPPETDIHASLAFKAGLAGLELAVVATIILLVTKGRTLRWHERWLDYRMLAEMLRHVRFLGLVGEGAALFRMVRTTSKAGSDWILWYVRATCREIGTGQGVFDDAYQRRILQTVDRFEIDDQLTYHRKNKDGLSALDRRLHRLGNRCFYLTALLLVAYLVAYLLLPGVSPLFPGEGGESMTTEILDRLKPWITFLDTFLPALGAAIAGIRFTGDFEGFAKRSADTASALKALKQDYADAAPQPRLGNTSHVLVATAGVLAEDIGGWQSLYGRKELALPA